MTTEREPAGWTRRELLSATALAGAAALTSSPASAAEPAPKQVAPPPRVRYCLNMSTIRGQKLSVPDQVELAAKAGYDAIEPWIGELRAYVDGGGNIADLRKRIADHGLAVASAIGFAQWIVDDDAVRKAGLEQAKSDMELIRSIGGTHLAAPPAGATKQTDLNLLQAADRYRALLEVGDSQEVIPQAEVWGFSTTLSRLGETMLVALESRHPRACILPDVYHLYKGGSEFAGLRLLAGSAIHCFHMNDYPATPPRDSIKDADRVYPGDGVAPLTQILRDLFATGFAGVLSLELFNPTYWQQDAGLVARTGLEKMKAAVAKARE
ncbi:MAG: sugar phosphate isomerase/epimerase family protein [Pirellulaceae bacterium]|nr:sugar phosphate isomerase/epimerase family protein [Pirellulaceae bacterium]